GVGLERRDWEREFADPRRLSLSVAILKHDVPALDVAKITQTRKEGRQEGIGGRRTEQKHAQASDFARRLRLRGEGAGEDAEGEADRERNARGVHGATAQCWVNTGAIFFQPSVLRNLICPLATRLKSRTSAASSLGSEPCVFTRRRNSSWSRSIVFVVHSVFHCAFGKR